MHDTLSSLVERALAGNVRPLEFFLRDQSRLPGPRANLELANDMSYLLAASVSRSADSVHSLLCYFTNADGKSVISNTPSEFVMLCGIIAFGACASAEPSWREEVINLLDQHACSPYWRVREAVALAFQHILCADTQKVIPHLLYLARHGSYLQQRAAIATIAEPSMLYVPELLAAALELQRLVLERLHAVPLNSRKNNEEFRILRRALGYTLSVVTAAAPDQGFALMRECAAWNDSDVIWILRENLKKKRLAKFTQDTERVARMLA
jgi:hypothetical protein